MSRSKKIQVVGIVLLLFCTVSGIAQSGYIPVKVEVTFYCTDNVCRVGIYNVTAPINYSLSDLEAKIEMQCGNLYYNLSGWDLSWRDGDRCGIKVNATYKF